MRVDSAVWVNELNFLTGCGYHCGWNAVAFESPLRGSLIVGKRARVGQIGKGMP